MTYHKNNTHKAKRLSLFFEFLVFGILIGLVEDLIAVKVATGATITWETVGIVVLVTIPFAILGELVVDNIDMTSFFHKIFYQRRRKE